VKAPEQLQSAFVLHSRRYRESSVIVDLFTQHYGIVPAVARGVHGGKSNHKRALLQPFQAIQCRWRGKGELVTLTDLDQGHFSTKLAKHSLYCGMYVNELLMRLLHRHDPHEDVYTHYHNLLIELQSSDEVEPLLRAFELTLLDELGYGLSFNYDAEGDPISPQTQYYLSVDYQFHIALDNLTSEQAGNAFPGSILLAIGQQNWHDRQVLNYAKQLTRLVLQPLLGSKPLQSRKLFRSLINDS